MKTGTCEQVVTSVGLAENKVSMPTPLLLGMREEINAPVMGLTATGGITKQPGGSVWDEDCDS